MAFLGIIIFSGCSSDDGVLPQQPDHELPVVGLPLAFDYASHVAGATAAQSRYMPTTRSWTPPTNYYLYNELYSSEGYVTFESFDTKTIDIFFTHLDGGPATPYNPLHGRLRFVAGNSEAEPPTEDHWKLALPNTVDEEEIKSGDYYVYGFIPRDAADDAGIELLSSPDNTWDKGAVLTILGMKTTMSDACVIIGAKEGPDRNTDNGLTTGDFKFNLDTGSTIVDGTKVINPNYLYLLFDHLGSALSISMKVHADYDAIRTIKLKEMRMQTAGDGGTTKAKMNVTVTLRSNGTGDNPIESVVYTPVGEELSDGIVYHDKDGLELSPTPRKFLGHFIPLGVKRIILTCTYDVYDKKGNLIRQNSKARNTIVLSDIITPLDEVRRGYKYNVNLTIKPTYLYVLSDPDEEGLALEIE